jgi:calmodulin
MTELSEEQIEEFREAFSLFDIKGEGTIETKELGQVLRSLGIHTKEEEKKAYVDKYDPFATGVIYFNDFLEIIVNKISESKPEDEITEAFKLFDVDGNGTIEIEAFKKAFNTYLHGSVSSKELDEICNYLKLDNERVIYIDEAVDKIMGKIKNHLV